MSEAGKKNDRIGITLYCIYLLLLVMAVVITGKLIWLQTGFQPDEEIVHELTPKHVKRDMPAVRGNILDCNGKVLAISTKTAFQICMDCTVMSKTYADDKQNGAEQERIWMEKAEQLSRELARQFPSKSAERYLNEIRKNRHNGKQYMKIGHPVDEATMKRISKFPLFRDGRNKGGLIVEPVIERKYPYGSLARRTIGFVRDESSNVANGSIGLEGKFDYVLSGKPGREWLRKCDYGSVRDFDSTYVQAVDGLDIRTTIDIDQQAVADRILREHITDNQDIESACFALMDVETGALRVIINLMRDPTAGGRFAEISNIFINRRGEPGSVFKTVTLAALLTDGKIKSLEQTIPTNHGKISGTNLPDDDHIPPYERDMHTNRISMYDGFKMSSNYVLATWAINSYGHDPMAFDERVRSFGIGSRFDFDLVGLASPYIASKANRKPWSNTDLGNVAYGYSTQFSPIYTLMFYNAIAGGGRLMKPYLVESIEDRGKVTEYRGPVVLKDSIFPKSVADTLTRALKAVTEKGTAKVLKNAAVTVAGKTGTAIIPYDDRHYRDSQGRKKNQGTFAGFFPADDPKYSVICVIYSKLSHKSYYGGSIPATVIKEFIDELVRTDPKFRESI